MRLATWDILEFSRDRQARVAGMAVGILAETSRSPECGGVGKKRKGARAGFALHGQAGRESEDGSFRAHSARNRADDFARRRLLVADHNAYHLGQLVLVRSAGLLAEPLIGHRVVRSWRRYRQSVV